MKNIINNVITEFINETRQDYLRWKRKNVTLRGIKELGKHNEVYGSFGKGLYTVPLSNKAMAKTYGDVYFLVNAIPKKPYVVQGINAAEMLRQGLVDKFCKKNGKDYDPRYFDANTTMEKEMQDNGYDGLIIKGREMVNYNPPEDVLYFENERQLENYYNSRVGSLN